MSLNPGDGNLQRLGQRWFGGARLCLMKSPPCKIWAIAQEFGRVVSRSSSIFAYRNWCGITAYFQLFSTLFHVGARDIQKNKDPLILFCHTATGTSGFLYFSRYEEPLSAQANGLRMTTPGQEFFTLQNAYFHHIVQPVMRSGGFQCCMQCNRSRCVNNHEQLGNIYLRGQPRNWRQWQRRKESLLCMWTLITCGGCDGSAG